MATLSKELQEYQDARKARPVETVTEIICTDFPAAPAKRISKLTNQAQVKRAALDIAKSTRAKKFTRVSQSFLDGIEADVRVLIMNRVKRQPSVGKTLT